jgi:hypothetical protein
MAPASASITPRLQLVLSGLEIHRARYHAVEFLDTGRELLGVPELFLDVLLYVLLDLLGPDAVRVHGVGDVVHDRLKLHKVRRLEKLYDALTLLGHLFRKDSLAAAIGLHAL